MHKFLPVTVMHNRLTPKVNRFFYKTFYVCLDVSSLSDLKGPLLGFEKWRPYSLRHKDFGFQDGSPIQNWLEAMIKTYDLKHHKIYLITMPRVFGYGFNPISFWLFFDEEENLQSVIADVNNTFGENHKYLIRDKDGMKMTSDQHYEAEKVFHVSPFMPVDGNYRFRFCVPEDFSNAPSRSSMGFWIDYIIDGNKILLTSMTGKLKPLNQKNLLKSFIHYPFMTILVMGRIHYQALKLWIKGIRYYPKAQLPKENMTESL
jgi:DUF1365 family protein